MKKLILILPFLALGVLIFNSCQKPCNPHDYGKIKLLPSERQICPYKGNEILVFTNTSGDTIVYKGNKWDSTYDGVAGDCREYYSTMCCGYSFERETLNIYFHENKYQSQMSVQIYNWSQWHSDPKYFDIAMTYQENLHPWSYEVISDYNTLALRTYKDTTSCEITFNNTLILGNKTFSSVYSIKQYKSAYNKHIVSKIQYVYYTIKEGIVGFKTKDGHLWYLK